MRNVSFPLRAIAAALALAVLPVHAATLQSAADNLEVANTKSVEFYGTGSWFQFGQAAAPTLPWPQFDVSSISYSINYDTSSAHIQYVRKQTIEPGRERPAPVEQRPDQYVSGGFAWNLATPPNATAPVATAQPAAVEERAAEIWATPQGFIKAALANNAVSKPSKAGLEVSFQVGGKYRYVGIINNDNQVEDVKTWIDNPVLGDTLVETKFSGYKNFGGTLFPEHIVRSLGGAPVLDIHVSTVKWNAPVDFSAPQNVVDYKAPAINVVSTKLAEGVYYLTGGTHHSVAIDQRDHIVIVEAPLNEERSLAVIAKAKELIPGKPIKYLINTHSHFDHSGGLRTYVNEGATIVTDAANRAFYQKAWAAPRTLNPDLLAKSKKAAKFETFKGKHVLTDGTRKIEIHSIAGNGHNDAFALVYLPAEKVLVEADAYTPLAPGAPLPPSVNPYSVNLYENILKLKLDVEQIAGLHGPKAVGLADLRTYIGKN